jgi:hypothetical protein
MKGRFALAATGLGLATLLAAGTLSARAACNLPGGGVLTLSGPGLVCGTNYVLSLVVESLGTTKDVKLEVFPAYAARFAANKGTTYTNSFGAAGTYKIGINVRADEE